MNAFQILISTIAHRRAEQRNPAVSQASQWERSRFRHSMLGEPGIHEAARLFGVGR